MFVRPRLSDHHGLLLNQSEVDFAIPFLDEDIPLYLDPFLLWKSPSQQDNALHTSMISSFNSLGSLFSKDEGQALKILKEISECDEVGLGNSKTKKGKRIGDKMAKEILSTFIDIPQIQNHGFTHLEEVQFLINNFSKDRISDIACNLLTSFLIDFSIQECEKHNIPIQAIDFNYFDCKKLKFINETVSLPVNPVTQQPILLVPKRWLRFVPWLNYEDYFKEYIATSKKVLSGERIPRVSVLEYNRHNYDQVQSFLKRKRLEQKDCQNDPLFTQIPVLSSKRKLNTIIKLPTGKTNNADQEYEKSLCPLLASMLYPDLDFAQPQSRTVNGVLIRDLIFYNNNSNDFLKHIYDQYGSRQIVFELKNTKEVSSTHVNQLNRYLSNEFGGFGILFTRNKPPKSVYKNTIDLWSGQRKCILIMDDEDLKLMSSVYENKQRVPIDVIKKKYNDFKMSCPG